MRNNNIQILRGISIILVIFTHLGVFLKRSDDFNFVHSFFDTAIGVDLFFVISGYLMGETFLRKIDGRSITSSDAFSFYKKRFQRLYFPCLFWAVFILVLYWVWIEQGHFKEFRQVLGVTLGAITFTGNFINATQPSVFGYFWSLGVEMQFYIILPLLTATCIQRRWIPCLLLLLVFTLVPGGIKTWWMFRANALFAGLLVWFISQSSPFGVIKESLNKYSSTIILTIFSVIIVSACFLSYPYQIFGGVSYTIISVILSMAFVVITFYEKPVFTGFNRFLIGVGNISFSLYLCHLPVFVLAKYIFSPYVSNMYFLALIGVLLSVVSAFLSYRFLEGKRVNDNAVECGP
jgi:peptidoglycan/LPS O-acetylase OafA/YrhL